VTDPKKDAHVDGGASGARAGGVSDNAFSGPAGVQSGGGNTQFNYYAAPSTGPAGPEPPPPGTGVRGMRRVAAALGGLLLAGAAGYAGVTYIQGDGDGEPVKYNFTSEDDKLCIDVEGNRDKPSRVQMWDCNHEKGQVWQWHGQELHAYTRCLEVKDEKKEPGSAAYFFDCLHTPTQKWEWVTGGKLRNVNSGLCLGYPESPASPKDVPLAVYKCESNEAREWEHH
jgi:hypothetical protein